MCTFESGFCGFTTSADSPTKWMIGAGRTTLPSMAPSADAKNNPIGSFAYVSAPSGQRMNQASRFYSPQFSRSATNCRVQVSIHKSIATIPTRITHITHTTRTTYHTYHVNNKKLTIYHMHAHTLTTALKISSQQPQQHSVLSIWDQRTYL